MTWQALYDNPAARVKGWVNTLLAHRAPLERAAGGQLGQVLGCGHWGCVVDILNTPYVLKLTVDPTEAHVWQKLVELINDERYGDDGFPRIKKIFKLEPGIPYGHQGRSRTAYGIVREKVVPVFDSKTGIGTPFTQQVLGVPVGWSTWALSEQAKQLPQNHKLHDFAETLLGLKRYQEAAFVYHQPRTYGWERSAQLEWVRMAEVAASRMTGAIGGPLGESLSMLASNEVLLRDVHFGNIGWRFLPRSKAKRVTRAWSSSTRATPRPTNASFRPSVGYN